MVPASIPVAIKDCYCFRWKLQDVRRDNFIVKTDRCWKLTGAKLHCQLLPGKNFKGGRSLLAFFLIGNTLRRKVFLMFTVGFGIAECTAPQGFTLTM